MQALAELLQLGGRQWWYPLLLQPLRQQQTAGGRAQRPQAAAVQAGLGLQNLQGHPAEFHLTVPHVGHPFSQIADPLSAARMQLLEHGQNLLPDPVAGELRGLVARVLPDRQGQVLADLQGVVALQVQQRPAQAGTPRTQEADARQRRQASQVAAAGQLQQHRFSPVAGGVAGHHIGAGLAGPLFELGVAPLAGRGFAGHLTCRGLIHLEGQLALLAPGAQFGGDPAGALVPAVVAVPQAQAPAMQRRQILQQRQQGHGVLPAGDRQQQGAALGQQLRLLKQAPVQAVMPGRPAQGRGCVSPTV